MFWLNASFPLRNAEDLALLVRVYRDVAGEAAFYEADGVQPLLTLTWCPQVMRTLRCDLTSMSYRLDGARIECRLSAADTVRGVAGQPSRLPTSSIATERRETLLWWAHYIDRALQASVANDPPIQELVPAQHWLKQWELYQAVRLSQLASYCVPHANGFLLLSTHSRSIVDMDWSGATYMGQDIAFHLGVGFMHCCSMSPARRQINAAFTVWESKRYEGQLSDYYGLGGLVSSSTYRLRALEDVQTKPLSLKKRCGRPPKPVIKTEPVPKTPEPAPDPVPEPVVKRGHGRPRKNPVQAQ